MNRGGIEDSGPDPAVALAGPEKDWRLLVLLLLGLGLLAAQLIGPAWPAWSRSGQGDGAGAGAEAGLVWLSGSRIAEGLYQAPRTLLPPLADSVAGLYQHLGLGVPPGPGNQETGARGQTSDGLADSRYPGLRLESNEQPRIIPYPARLDSLFFRPIPVNRADEELLITIPGIGPQLAARIVARRQERGGFQQPADLLEVSGIGQVKLEQLRRHLSFEQ